MDRAARSRARLWLMRWTHSKLAIFRNGVTTDIFPPDHFQLGSRVIPAVTGLLAPTRGLFEVRGAALTITIRNHKRDGV
jgi:hypothetical protein